MSYKRDEVDLLRREAHAKGFVAAQKGLSKETNPYNPEGSKGSLSFGYFNEGYEHGILGMPCADCPKTNEFIHKRNFCQVPDKDEKCQCCGKKMRDVSNSWSDSFQQAGLIEFFCDFCPGNLKSYAEQVK